MNSDPFRGEYRDMAIEEARRYLASRNCGESAWSELIDVLSTWKSEHGNRRPEEKACGGLLNGSPGELGGAFDFESALPWESTDDPTNTAFSLTARLIVEQYPAMMALEKSQRTFAPTMAALLVKEAMVPDDWFLAYMVFKDGQIIEALGDGLTAVYEAERHKLDAYKILQLNLSVGRKKGAKSQCESAAQALRVMLRINSDLLNNPHTCRYSLGERAVHIAETLQKQGVRQPNGKPYSIATVKKKITGVR